MRLLLILALLLGSSGLRASAATATAPAAQATALVTSVDAVAIPVTDMDRSVAFYTGVLGFTVVSDRELAGTDYERLLGVFGLRVRRVRLALGAEAIELSQFLVPRGRPLPADTRANDHWFQHIAIVVRDIDEGYAWLRRHGVEHASSGPQVLPASIPAAAGIGAFYFRDPDGNFLEILSFPPGKGESRWQAEDRLFLGIDHTAIVVDDTERSLGYYRDLLGLTLAGGSENHGIEQEHLNNVFGARLRITTLRAATGPGVELLEYLAPGTGRVTPADTRANDGWQWQVLLRASDLEPVWRAVRAGRVQAISPGVVRLDGSIAGIVVHDPDRHATWLLRH
jgi:catechol 2,3-dioxygenase-like lactoylglutathione lyase family enzyme